MAATLAAHKTPPRRPGASTGRHPHRWAPLLSASQLKPLGRPRGDACAFFCPRPLPPSFRCSFAFLVLDLFVPYCVPCQFPCGSGGRERRWRPPWWRRLMHWPVGSTSAAAADREAVAAAAAVGQPEGRRRNRHLPYKQFWWPTASTAASSPSPRTSLG